eukprot:2137586-Alexandrium_andersonii.AAC.1
MFLPCGGAAPNSGAISCPDSGTVACGSLVCPAVDVAAAAAAVPGPSNQLPPILYIHMMNIVVACCVLVARASWQLGA